MANYIRSRDKPPGDFEPSSKTLCFQCMDRGTHYVFIRGSRKYACEKHFRAWVEEAQKSERHTDRLLSEEWR